jgi:hypothetical protein
MSKMESWRAAELEVLREICVDVSVAMTTTLSTDIAREVCKGLAGWIKEISDAQIKISLYKVYCSELRIGRSDICGDMC